MHRMTVGSVRVSDEHQNKYKYLSREMLSREVLLSSILCTPGYPEYYGLCIHEARRRGHVSHAKGTMLVCMVC